MSRIVLYSTYESWEGIQLRLGMFEEATVEYICACFDWLIWVRAAGWAVDCGICPTISIALPLGTTNNEEVEQSGSTAGCLSGQLSECFRKAWDGIHNGRVYIRVDGHVRGVRASLWSLTREWRGHRVLQLMFMSKFIRPWHELSVRSACCQLLLYSNLLDPHSADG